MALLALAGLLLALPADAGAAPGPQPLWQRCDGAAGDLSCSIPRGIGVSPTSGHLYLAEGANIRNRIDEYTAWGELVRAWGWGVSTGAEELQTCTTASSCKAGIEGGGKGQLAAPQGVAVDSAGNVYVTEFSNHRVQKFDSEGHFLLMFGAKVNKTKVEEGKPAAEQNRCPVDPGDVCQAGVEGVGNGEFGAWVSGSYIATGPSPNNLVYVGDKGRVQVFNPNGTYKEDFPDPEGLIAAGGTVKALAAAPSGGLYLAFAGSFPNAKPNVTRLTSAGKASVSPGCVANVANPTAIAMATNAEGKPTGNLYVFDETAKEVRQFSASCVDKEAPFAKKDVSVSSGLAAGTTCLTAGADVYLSDSSVEGLLRAYGPAPDKTGLCPKPIFAPEVVSQYATSVGSEDALLGAQINPRFYADTTYQLQYGTAACIEAGGWEAACVEEKPPAPAPLGAEAMDFQAASPSVFLQGLSPATAYRYRFVAQSSGGGPVEGAERGFATFPPQVTPPGCPNQAFRTGGAALLPDCRAYELVSPLDKEGGQILTKPETFGRPTQLSESSIAGPDSGDKLTYSSYTPFDGPESAPYTSQYIASREDGVGWASAAISPPRGAGISSVNLPFNGVKGEFEAFSADLCSAWLIHNATTAPPLAPDAAPYNGEVYRRSNCGAAAGSYTALGKVTAVDPARVQGVSTDGGTAIFRTAAHLTQEAPTAVGTSLNCQNSMPFAPSFQWLAEGVPIGGATSSSYTAKAGDAGKTIQCRMRVSGGGSGTIGDANPAWVIAPYPATPPPLAPQSIPAPSASAPLAVGGAGGQMLGCDPDAAGWEGSPSFEYQWYRDGIAIASAESPEYTVQAADLASAAAFQCEVVATNAGGKVVATSEALATDPASAAPVARPNMTTNQLVTYESFDEGRLRAVCILPESGTQSNGCSAGTENQFRSGTVGNALSEDGSRVFWTNSSLGEGAIYARIDGEKTVQVSSGTARFWTAAADGSRAIISSAGNLYEVDISDPEAPVSTLIAEGAKGVVGASEDVTRLYFVSTKKLTGSEENSEEGVAQEGQPNLYLRNTEGGGEELSFLGTLVGGDVSTFSGSGLSPVAVEPYEHAARTSSDGENLAFMSQASLTGYDNADSASGEADAEVFVYDARTGRLICASCNPSGGRPAGGTVTIQNGVIPTLPTAAQLPPIQSQLYASHVLSEDGGRLFFEAVAPLLPTDTNGKIDVYEWEAPGTGTCAKGGVGYSAQNEGCLSLISSGKSPQNSSLLDASPEGRDVFFTTGESLLGYDPGSIDIYDARSEGGLPAPPTLARPCEGEACQSPPPPPAELPSASEAFSGQGNPAPPKHKHRHKQKQRKNKHKRAQHKHRRAAR